MKTYRAMLAEIERLQRKAEARRRVEIKGVVKHIRELISKHGLTSHDLGLDGAAPPRPFKEARAAMPAPGRKAGKAPKAAASKGVPRYRDPATGKTWTGRGKPPNWIVGAKDRTPFEIGADAAPPAAKAAKSTPAAKAVKAKRAPKAAARKARAPQSTAKKAAVKRAAPAQAAKRGKAQKTPKAQKAPKAPKAARLPKPPVPKSVGKRAKAPKEAAPAPAPADAGTAAVATSA